MIPLFRSFVTSFLICFSPINENFFRTSYSLNIYCLWHLQIKFAFRLFTGHNFTIFFFSDISLLSFCNNFSCASESISPALGGSSFECDFHFYCLLRGYSLHGHEYGGDVVDQGVIFVLHISNSRKIWNLGLSLFNQNFLWCKWEEKRTRSKLYNFLFLSLKEKARELWSHDRPSCFCN